MNILTTVSTYVMGAVLRELRVDPDAGETRDERFEFGLDCVLDGIAMRVRQIRDGARG